MKHLFSLLFFFSLLFISCSKDTDTSASEDAQIEDYITAKKLTVTEKTATGLRYIRTLSSTGASVVAGQTLTVKYAGRLMNDTQFEAGSFSFKLGSGSVIKGFDEGMAKMKVGEKATLIFPSALGYGSTGIGSIPGNAPLVFDVEVISAK